MLSYHSPYHQAFHSFYFLCVRIDSLRKSLRSLAIAYTLSTECRISVCTGYRAVALSDTKLRSINAKPYSGAAEVTDGDGLSVRITPTGTITFQFRYRWNGKPVRLSIGRYPAMSLKEARVVVGEMRELYLKGLNPKNYFAKEDGELTLKECLDQWWSKYVETLKPNTQTLYKSVVYNTMYTEFPDAPVVNIPVSAWVRFFDKQEKKNSKKARVLLLQLRSVMNWCISRQLWWGHRIPAYFLPEGGYVVAATPEEALALAKEKTGNADLKLEDLRQDEDCLDTWFSSWLWPISLFDGINNPGNEEINYYYPTSDLVTGPDIIFFWVARMIMAGYEYEGKMPFKNVYFTGIVRDKLGRKMSKSLGNSPDPLDLIEKYGADGVRMGMMLSAPAGNDILFDDALCEQGRNFNNKIWNAFRLIKGWEVSVEVPVPEASELAVRWFEAKQNEVAAEVADLFSKYRLSEALMAVYKLFWDEFSSWYLEMIKPAYGQPINRKVYEATIGFFDNLLHLLHPFMPFITEELWQHLCDRTDGESLMVSPLSMSALVDEDIIREFEVVKEVISNIRSIRLQKNIAQKEVLELQVIGENPVVAFNAVVTKMCNLSSINVVENKADGAASFMVATTEYAVPLGNMIDVEAEIARMEAELKHKEGFLQGVLKKLGNEKFVNNAPAAVLEMERKKQADAESIIKSLKESIAALKKA